MKSHGVAISVRERRNNLARRRHKEALETSSFLTTQFRQMYQPMAAKISAKRVVNVLCEAGVVGLLIGTHGVGGYRSQPRATQDVDVLIRKRDHRKAVQAIQAAFPKLRVQDTPVVTRFVDPHTQLPVIDLMKPTDALFKVAFRNCIAVGETHRVPDLELALVTTFAAMVSPNRIQSKKLVDAGDFVDMVMENFEQIDHEKLMALADLVYLHGGMEIIQLIRDIEAGRPIRI